PNNWADFSSTWP
nr:Chain P, peptide from Intersectin-1, residues 840-851 [synthetic construct]3HS9_P Chain P, peptide from Intersectin-1, residues 841-851 [synthetic construct]